MIKFAEENDKEQVRQMWKICFNDTEEFMDIYFSEKYRNENTLIYFENNNPVASLQMLLYLFSFYGVVIPVAYISGACTLPQFREKGYMNELLVKSFEVMKRRNIPLSLLNPADKKLRSYYKKYGFETVFDEGKKSGYLKSILDEAQINLDRAYTRFNAIYRNRDFCILKSKSDFKTIVEDAKLTHLPPKNNLAGMARLINVDLLLNFFAAKYPDKSFSFKLSDTFLLNNNATFLIKNGVCHRTEQKTDIFFALSVDELCRLLFGFYLKQFSDYRISQHFEPQKPILNLMME